MMRAKGLTQRRTKPPGRSEPRVCVPYAAFAPAGVMV